MSDFGITIGIEVHIQLLSSTKMFCRCKNSYGDEPNTNICPTCMGLPGALPTVNERATRMGVMLASALECKINKNVPYHRKNYFYPDLPKGYQITQFYTPLGEDGKLRIYVDKKPKDIHIERIHLEEDSGKMFHDGDITTANSSLLDYNRCGAPLAEIVTKPCMKSAEEAWGYLVGLRNLVRFLGVSTGNMDEGALRCDVNVSIDNPDGSFGTKTEIKNLNSFRSARRAIEFEVERQRKIIDSGNKVVTQTLHFNENTGETSPMRSKEELNDYRYFPEPDIPPLVLTDSEIKEIKAETPETPNTMLERFMNDYKLSLYDSQVLTADKDISNFFEETLTYYNDPKKVCNWLTIETFGKLSKENKALSDSNLTPENLAKLVKMVTQGTITGNAGKEILDDVISGHDPEIIAEKKGLKAVVDEDMISGIISKVLAENEKQLTAYRNGKTQLFGFFVGAVMKESKGNAPGNIVQKILKKMLTEN
ncbi:MAG: Asp-tRNA(Asn)/Glu-tRNA(Gln) amidotransferase subunit GatB [Caldisericia bacterium]